MIDRECLCCIVRNDWAAGGVDELLKGAGKDATRLIRTAHSFVNVHTMLATCLVGTLADSYWLVIFAANRKTKFWHRKKKKKKKKF